MVGSITVVTPKSVNALDEKFYSSNNILFYSPDSQTCTAAPNPVGNSGGTELSVPADFTLGSEVGKRPVNLARKLMEDYNFQDFQAAGIVGNFMRESSNALPPDINEGGAIGPPAFSGGYGWAQWTGGRQVSFINYAVENGYMGSRSVNATDAANYAYLNQELTRTSESRAVGALKATTTVEQATSKWEEVFERAGVVAGEDRLSRARLVLTGLRGSGSIGDAPATDPVQPGTGTEATDCTSSNTAIETEGVTFDRIAFPLLGSKSVVTNPGIFTNNDTDLAGHPYTAYDILANDGTRVVAFTDGVVRQKSSLGSLGYLVGVYNQEKDIIISYIHLNDDSPEIGQTLLPGDVVGTIAPVERYPDVNVDHLHIDAEKGSVRDPCSRDMCAESVRIKFVSIGADLFKSYQELPD